ncbi:protein of unknown function [Nakamurella panacisegetis]|uniref:DUF2020 domain-containing protein n=1 Tax=Nakamurella panacisegetis TaxID=1090615 RepID=A0A1H0KQX3_9ACTN|nr:DUF2020 domain-containing protein [Nakamurella panacisegetis]SDO58368.1 protein of unknown function [Nakamurella panacisegetis]
MVQVWRPAGRRTRAGVLVGAAVIVALVSGCTSRSGSAPAASTTVTGTSTVTMTTTASRSTPAATSGRSTAVSTVTRTKGGATITAGAGGPPATKEPAAVDGDCPYLSADVVSEVTGQHHGQTQLLKVAPHPICVFYRSDGGLMASVRVIAAADARAATAAVNQHVPIAGSQPASQPTGWSGGSMSTGGQMTQDSKAKSVYAVSRGNIAVVVEENESPSIKARVIAVCAIYGLGLQAGAKPDYCSVPN